MIRAALTLSALALCACPFVPDPVKPIPVPGATCADVCARGAELGCDYAQPTPAGASCVEVCERTIEIAPLDLGCRSAVERCEDAPICED